MDTTQLVSALDAELDILHQVKALLSGTTSGVARRGRPPKKKRVLSAEARARIAAAQKRRWAKQKAAAK